MIQVKHYVSDITKGIIILLFRDYWATPYQKEIIQEKERQYRQKIEDAKCGFDIFNKKESKKINDEIKEDTSNNNLQIEVKKENLLEKIIRLLKKKFHIN